MILIKSNIIFIYLFRLLVNKNKLYLSPKNEALLLSTDDTIQQDYDITIPIGSTSINPINIEDLTTLTSTSSSTPLTTTFFNSLSSSTNSSYTPITRINNNLTPISGSTSTSNSTIRSDRSSTNLLAESSTSSNLVYNNIDNFIQEIVIQLQLDHRVSGMTILTINNTVDVVNEILEWFEKINDADLLQKPMISVITERYVLVKFL